MPHLPDTSDTPLVRTDFADDAAWNQLVKAISTPSEDGFLANVRPINQKDFESLEAAQLINLAANTDHAVLFVADHLTMSHPEHPVLCIEAFAPNRTFRVIPSEMWSAENNLSLANLDFQDFTDAAGADGVFRGF
jgi:hypothetical protein